MREKENDDKEKLLPVNWNIIRNKLVKEVEKR
jgi:hypothetical protein